MVGIFDPTASAAGSDFETAVGRRAALIHIYQAWEGPNPDFDQQLADLAKGLSLNNAVLMITWEPWMVGTDDYDQPKYRMASIAAGAHDAYLRRWFKAARDLKEPIFVRFAHEMNGFWYPWGEHVTKSSDYVAAWRHVVKLSRKVGADNINWVWAPNADPDNRPLDRFYPGTAYVDWVGTSGFNWGGPAADWAGWRDFSEIFGPTLRRLKKYHKPIMIAETGSIENPRPNEPAQKTKPAWIKKAFASIKKSNPPISLIVWQNDVFRSRYDWRATTSPGSLQSMKAELADPVFSGKFD